MIRYIWRLWFCLFYPGYHTYSRILKLVVPSDSGIKYTSWNIPLRLSSVAVFETCARLKIFRIYWNFSIFIFPCFSQLQESPKEMTLPLPMVTLLNCEKISPAKLKLVKEVMLIPPVQLSLKQVLFHLHSYKYRLHINYIRTWVYIFHIVLTKCIFYFCLPARQTFRKCHCRILTQGTLKVNRWCKRRYTKILS